jgi:2-methylaconitate cis-trans-isomerase PrpF
VPRQHTELQDRLHATAALEEDALAEAERLRADGAAKVALLEEFEQRFSQQHRSSIWDPHASIRSASSKRAMPNSVLGQ